MQNERRALWTSLWKQLEQASSLNHAQQQQQQTSSIRMKTPSLRRQQSSTTTTPILNSITPNSGSSSSNISGYVSRIPTPSPFEPLPTAIPAINNEMKWFGGILLGVWDNVTGPRVEHAWLSDGTVEPEQLHEIARDSLAGTLEDNLVVKFVVLPHNGSVVCSVSFNAPFGDCDQQTKLSFAIFAPRKSLCFAVGLHRVLEDKLMHLSLIAKSILTRRRTSSSLSQQQQQDHGECEEEEESLVDKLSSPVIHSIILLESAISHCYCSSFIQSPLGIGMIISSSSPSSPAVSNSSNPHSHLKLISNENNKLFNSEAAICFGEAIQGFAVAFGVDLLSRSITAHLLSRGFTVVIGPDEISVCTITDTLSVFLLDSQDKLLSSRCSNRGSVYHPDLILQGIIGTISSSHINEEQLIQSPLPTTIIDISSPLKNVWQPRSPTEFACARRDFYKLQLTKISSKGQQHQIQQENSQPPSPLFPETPNQTPIQHPGRSPLMAPSMVEDASSSMPELPQMDLNQRSAGSSNSNRPTTTTTMSRFPPNSTFKNEIQEWLPKEGLLKPVQQSSSLILDLVCQTLRLPVALRLPHVLNFIRYLMCKAITLIKLVTSDIKAHNGTTEGSGRWMKENLGLQDDNDFNIVIAFADRLYPGIYDTIMSVRITLEEKFIELFEGFV